MAHSAGLMATALELFEEVTNFRMVSEDSVQPSSLSTTSVVFDRFIRELGAERATATRAQLMIATDLTIFVMGVRSTQTKGG